MMLLTVMIGNFIYVGHLRKLMYCLNTIYKVLIILFISKSRILYTQIIFYYLKFYHYK